MKRFTLLTTDLTFLGNLLKNGQFYSYTKRTLGMQIGSHLGFLTALWMIKFSFLLFYKRLAEGRPTSRLWLFTFGFCLLAYIGNVVGFFFVCVPFHTYFDSKIGPASHS